MNGGLTKLIEEYYEELDMYYIYALGMRRWHIVLTLIFHLHYVIMKCSAALINQLQLVVGRLSKV